MEQENAAGNGNKESTASRTKPTRKGLHRYFHASPLAWYLSAVISLVFLIIGIIELFDIRNLRFIRMSNSFQFAILFVILGMVSRIYYEMFEAKYDSWK